MGQVRFDTLPAAPRVASDDSPASKAKQMRVDRLAASIYKERRLQSTLSEVVTIPAGCTVGQLKQSISETLGAVYRMFKGFKVRGALGNMIYQL